tara:strand:+ start:3617 stop:4081 length:465 start_codon:yes stop_codon:yes gene_type:complete
MFIEVLLASTFGMSEPDFLCLSRNIYFESRNQSVAGQIAVAQVVMNRVKDSRYPDTVCGVVEQGKMDSNGVIKRNQCQFSWFCDGLTDVPKNKEMWVQSQESAIRAVDMYQLYYDITDGSTHYHSTKVNPTWASSIEEIVQIDDHIFYKWNNIK